MSNLFSEQNIEIDEKKLRKMRFHIYFVEREYYRTRKYTVSQLKEKIRDIIIKEYNKQI